MGQVSFSTIATKNLLVQRENGRLSLTNVERGDNVTVVAFFNAAGAYVHCMMIFIGIIKMAEFEDGFSPGSAVGMGDSEWINENLFLDWLHFLRFKTEGRVLLISDNH
jgi:hypothetical protein